MFLREKKLILIFFSPPQDVLRYCTKNMLSIANKGLFICFSYNQIFKLKIQLFSKTTKKSGAKMGESLIKFNELSSMKGNELSRNLKVFTDTLE